MDRSLTYHRHLESLHKKLTSRVTLLRRLAGSGLGSGVPTLRIATLALVHSIVEYCAPVWCRSAHARLNDPAINDALQRVTGCLRPAPMDDLPILAGIQPAELRRNGATLSLHAVSCSLDICCIQRSPVYRVQTHGASNRNTHLNSPHNISSVSLTTITHLRSSGRITGSPMECGVDGQLHKTPHFHPRHQPSPFRKKSLGPAQPPPHWCRTFPLLLAQMGYGLLCGL